MDHLEEDSESSGWQISQDQDDDRKPQVQIELETQRPEEALQDPQNNTPTIGKPDQAIKTVSS